MIRVLFPCDGAKPPSRMVHRKWDDKIPLDQAGRKANFNLRIDNIRSAILKEISPISEDLIRIASYVYVADQSVSRGGKADVYGRNWCRDLHFVIPVSDPSFWNNRNRIGLLCDTLAFLTGDSYDFGFVKGSPALDRQLFLDMPGLDQQHRGADCVMLLSGGADSLCAVVEKVAEGGCRPILVSHRSTPLRDNYQSHLVTHLIRRFPAWSFPHVSVWAHLRGEEAKEYTQRSRSFLFVALSAAVAFESKLSQIFVADNGIVSINLPMTAQVLGTFASRSTHPKFLHQMQYLLTEIFDREVHVTNPLQFKTRAETLISLREHNCAELLQETISCTRTRQPKVTPHCGVCSQCIDRRFASIAADMQDYDLPERYQVDIFTDTLAEGLDRTQVESYVRFAQQISSLSEDEIFKQFVELFDCILSEDPDVDATAKAWVSLLQRHASQVRRVVEDKLKEHADALFNATLPASCLIRLVASGTHAEEPVRQFARRTADLLHKGIPKVFQSRKPDDEHEVQDAVHAILTAAKQDLDRELPLLPFAGISTKPDFSRLDKGVFYIEMKYIKSRPRLNSIIKEIVSGSVIYGRQGAFALFAVYDPNHFIPDDEAFVRDLHLGLQTTVSVIR